MTPAQLVTLKTDIQANSDANTLYINGNLDGLAALHNLTAVPDFWVWRTRVARDEIVGDAGPEGTTFIWNGNGFITRTTGELSAFAAIFDEQGYVNPSLLNVRQAFADIFSGTGNAATNRTHLLAIARRKATRLEKVFATGTGSTASPGLLVVTGPLGVPDLIGL